jgi:hypothetical protein
LSIVSRPLVALAIALFLALSAAACEERFSSHPPPLSPDSLAPASSSNGVEAILSGAAGAPTDAGSAPVDTSHAFTVMLCATSPDPCPASEAEATYRVIFGSGRGVVRTRGQAMADLYKELRDRLAGGERLDAETHAPRDGGTVTTGMGAPTKPSASDDDPISQCAFQLVDLVDGVGEVTLDVVHGSHGCRVALGRTADGGALRCLVQEPESARRPGRR